MTLVIDRFLEDLEDLDLITEAIYLMEKCSPLAKKFII